MSALANAIALQAVYQEWLVDECLPLTASVVRRLRFRAWLREQLEPT
jgi:hypothetical protein